MSRPRAFLRPAVVAAVALFACAAYGDERAPAASGYDPVTAAEGGRTLVRVVDTESSLGPLAATPRTVALDDLVRFHGHPCDGLVAAAEGVALGLKALFPDGVVDRTDVAAATNASPCYSDVTAYLTGARTLYGTLVIDRELGDEWILLRRSTGRAVRVLLRPGVKPEGLPALERQLRGEGCDAGLIRRVQRVQAGFIRTILDGPADAVYEVEELDAFPYPLAGSRPDAAKAACGRATEER